MIVRTSVAIVLLAILGFGLAELLRRQSLFYPERHPSGDWEATGLARAPQDVWFEAADGTKLHGWLIEADDPEAPLVVFFHGNGGNITHRIVPAVELANHGLSVFLFDYRGYGRSEGRATEGGLYQDSLAAWDLMSTRFDRPMIAYGESLGGPYAAFVAAERDPCAVVMDSTFPSIRSIAREIYDPAPVQWLLRPGLETAKHLNRSTAPVLVMHSAVDEVIPIELGRELFEKIEGPKEWYESTRAAHAALSWYDGERYHQRVLELVRTHCAAAPADEESN